MCIVNLTIKNVSLEHFFLKQTFKLYVHQLLWVWWINVLLFFFKLTIKKVLHLCFGRWHNNALCIHIFRWQCKKKKHAKKSTWELFFSTHCCRISFEFLTNTYTSGELCLFVMLSRYSRAQNDKRKRHKNFELKKNQLKKQLYKEKQQWY